MASGDIASARLALAPSGTLRATINVGNPVLARRDDTGAVSGISVRRASSRMMFEPAIAVLTCSGS